MKTFACLIRSSIRNVNRITCSAIHLDFIVPHCFSKFMAQYLAALKALVPTEV